MDSLLTVFILTIVLGIIIVPGMIMYNARKWRKIHSQEWQSYQILTGHLNRLKSDIERQADEWPMYARPVLYTRQDHDAQIEFAHAQERIYEANALLPVIIKHKLSDASENNNKLFALIDNLSTINNGSRFSKSLFALQEMINGILATKENIKKDREINLQKQEAVCQDLQSFAERINEAEQSIESLHQANDDILWAHTLARQSFDAASRCIQFHTEDGLEYAIADVLLRVGKDILYYLDLYVESLQEERFQLDDFARLLRAAYHYLNITLEIDELNNWRALRQADNYLKILPHKLTKADSSLQQFKSYRVQFENLERIVKSYNLERAIKRADALQKECAYYWYPYHQRPEIWQRAIENRPLPLKTILDLKNEYLAQLQSIVESTQGLKQSSLPDYLNKFKRFIETYRFANGDIQLLYEELFKHKQARIKVLDLMSNGGSANKAIQVIILIVQDTDPNIKDTGREITQTYQNYYNLAQVITGANFPELIQKLYDLIEKCNDLEIEHGQMMIKLEDLVSGLKQRSNEYLIEIKNLTEGFPKINDAILDLFLVAQKDGRAMLDGISLRGGYNHLNQSHFAIQSWLDCYEYQITSVRNQKLAFETSSIQVKAELSNLSADLKTRQILNQFAWSWAKAEIQQAIENARVKIEELWRLWNMYETQGWRTLYLSDAIDFCNDIYQKNSSIISELKQSFRLAEREEIELTNRRRGLLRVINSRKKRGLPLPLEEEFAETLCNSAIWAASKTEAKIALDIAQKIIGNLASQEDIRQGQTIINNINTGGGAYIEGNVNMGDNSAFVGRDYSS